MLTFLTRYRADFALCFCGGGGGVGGSSIAQFRTMTAMLPF